tara:strand:+ start:1108 stop:1737 length:630 start_codon:yes stop_codon:yes gene_type:complete
MSDTEMSLDLASAATLFASMLILALVPSLSVVTVTARAAAYGFRHGAAAAAGIVAGDLVFILLAVLGLAALASSLDGVLIVLKYGGGAYLIWLGVRLWRAGPARAEPGAVPAKLSSSFFAGLLLTLGDQKAVLFYLVFFPAFVDLNALTAPDIAAILAIAAVSVGTAKLAYACLAARAGRLFGPRASSRLTVLAAGMLIVVGVFLIAAR